MDNGAEGAVRMAEEKMAEEPSAALSFGFSASGWLMLYQLGVAHALQRHGVHECARFVGSSGGAAVSAALALNVDAQLLRDFMLRCCADYHRDPLRKMFRMREYARACIERCMDSQTFQHAALKDGRLNVSVTLLPSMRNVIISSFGSNEEYVDACLASCTATPFAGFPFQLRSSDPKLDGNYVLDGGASNMLPVLGPGTIRVSPLYCLDADIKPSRYVPLHWGLFPGTVAEMRELFWLGARDAMQWMHENGYASLKLDHRCFRERLTEAQLVARIRPIAVASRVSDQSSHDATVVCVNPQRFALDARLRSGSAGSADSWSSARVERLIRADAAKSGKAMSLGQERVHKVQDSMAVALVLTSVKPMALGVVYAELTTRAVLSTAAAAFAAVETNRRKKVSQSKGWLSMRRWVHDGMVGSHTESLESARDYLQAALDPELWLTHLPLVGSHRSKTSADGVPRVSKDLHSKSLAYRVFQRASVW